MIPHDRQRLYVPTNIVTFTDGQTLGFGPFAVTPILVDHSAYDAYALLVEAGGQRLLYSGDLRAHGRNGGLFERLVRDPPRGIDTLLLGGSSLGRLDDDRTFPSEAEIEDRFVVLFEDTAGLALVAASAQNIDRVVSLYRACKRTGRTLVLDLYAAEVLAATGNPRVPQSDWPGARALSRAVRAMRHDQGGRTVVGHPDIVPVVTRALAYREPGAAYDVDRLSTNLLSSQPLVFNLFGLLTRDLQLATRFVAELFPGTLAKRIVAAFGEGTFEIIEAEPDCLTGGSYDRPMSESSPPALGLLAEALDHLAINGCVVTLDGEPTRYHVDGEPSTEGEIVALAFRLGMGSPQ